jgi:hypothetical protein
LIVLAKTFDVAEVRSEEELKAVGAFRYKCYLAEGLIEPRPEESFLDEYDFVDTARIFMVLSCGRIVGTIRLHILDATDHRSATMTAFSDVLMPKILSGMTLIDGARFAVAPDLGALRLSVARQTLRLYSKFERSHGVDYGVAAIEESRVEFYHRLYGFNQIAEPRSYGGLKKNLVLMGVDFHRHGIGAIVAE